MTGKLGFLEVDIKRMIHLIPLLPDEACIRNKNICLSINTRPIPFTTEVVGYLRLVEGQDRKEAFDRD